MGVTTAEMIADKLIAAGTSPSLPVAVLERGTLPGSRTLRSVLADLGSLVVREQVISPAILVIGDVAALANADHQLTAFATQAESQT